QPGRGAPRGPRQPPALVDRQHAGTSWPRRAAISRSVLRSVNVAIVAVGFIPDAVGHVLPPKTYPLGTSWHRPWPSTTDVAGSSPIRVVPSRCQPVLRARGVRTSRAP